MSGKSLFSPATDALTKTLSFLEERHRIIANNIANADTPFFKAKAAPLEEFQEALSKAIDRARSGRAAGLALKPTRHVADGPSGLVIEPVEARGADAGILRHDGNNVNLDKEVSDLAQNAIMHRALSDLLRKQYLMLQSAIRERVD